MAEAHFNRRALLAAGATLLATAAARKVLAQDGGDGHVAMRPFSEIVRATPPEALPDVHFTTLDGAPRRLADFAGKPVVLNVWATWCIPCVAELPELDRLAAANPGLAVLAVSVDRGGAAIVKPFLAAHGIAHLTPLLDHRQDGTTALKVVAYPTTLLIGPEGRLRGRLEGPAAWAGGAPAIAALMRD